MASGTHPFIEHVEAYLGPIQSGARLTEDVNWVWFRDMPAPGARTYMTLGLSHHALEQSEGPKKRVELLIACRNEFVEKLDPMALLTDVLDHALRVHSAPPRGTVIGPRGRFFAESAMEALYCTMPTYFHDEFVEFDGFPDLFLPVWLVADSSDRSRVRSQPRLRPVR
jgi:hypothetical protein